MPGDMLAGLFLFPDAVKRLFFTPHEAVAAERAYAYGVKSMRTERVTGFIKSAFKSFLPSITHIGTGQAIHIR